MASYQIRWKSSAQKELRRLPQTAVTRIVTAVSQLTSDPHPPGSRKLIGSEYTYRIRVGDYRVIYDVQGSDLVIEIIRVGHRKDVYQG